MQQNPKPPQTTQDSEDVPRKTKGSRPDVSKGPDSTVKRTLQANSNSSSQTKTTGEILLLSYRPQQIRGLQF